jgi:O-succinylbenzoic acid--CoA ligase
MTLALVRCLDDPQALWEELEGQWRQGSLVGLAPPQERAALQEAVLGGTAAIGDAQHPPGHLPPAPQGRLHANGPTEPLHPVASLGSEGSWGAALVLGSGGSSGGRRWCLQPLAHLQASARACGLWLADQGIDPQRCLHLDALPLHHVSGLMPLIRARTWGAELRWLAPDLLRGPALLPQACPLPGDRSVLLSLVPTQLHRLLNSPEAVAWLRGCAVIWVGGAALADDLATRARAAELPLAPCYGATETAAMVCALPPGRFLAGEQGCGSPLRDVELRLEGEAGAIAVRSARLSPGWFAMGRLHPFPDAEGWWRSGDAGTWSAEVAPGAPSDQPTSPTRTPTVSAAGPESRSLIIHGRLDGAIHSGGETVFPDQVRERLLGLIQAAGLPVAELLLLGERDAHWGERLVALVRWESTDPPQQAGADDQAPFTELAALARALPPSQRPARWLNCPTLTPADTGKWQRSRWRQWLLSQPAHLH